MGGEVIEDDADALPASGKATSTSSRMQRAKSSAVRRSVTLTLRQRAMGIDEDEEIDGAVAAILVVEALEPSGCGRDRLARFADGRGWVGLSSKQTTGRFGSSCSA